MPTRLVRLSERQYAATVQAAFDIEVAGLSLPFSLVNTADHFSTRADSYRVGEAELGKVLTAAADVASAAVVRLNQNGSSCLEDTTAFDACATSLIQSRGQVLFHRPLSNDEVVQYVGLATELLPLFDRAAALEAMLRAPQFLFRTELGEDAGSNRALTPYEIAHALSYTLTDGPPDETLWNAAAAGELTDPYHIRQEVARLLSEVSAEKTFSDSCRSTIRIRERRAYLKIPCSIRILMLRA